MPQVTIWPQTLNRIMGIFYSNIPGTNSRSISGLDKDLDQWVFHPLLFNLMSILLHISIIKLQKMQSLVKRPNICLTYFKEKLLVSNTCCVFRKTCKIYKSGVY